MNNETTASIPADHPLRKSVWIWPEGYMYLLNHFAQFRYDFDLKKIPGKAPFFITADKSYRLYVNGNYVCRGPARGYQSHWPFDEVDIRQYLQIGKNWISIEAYTPGISTFQYLHYTKAGMLCAAKWGEIEIHSDSKTWKMRRASAYNVETGRLSLQLDFQEDFNAAEDDRSWIFSEKEPKGWRAEYFPEGGHQVLSTPFGQPPYDSVEPRGIPMLREDIIKPAIITSAGAGNCSGDYKTCKNISWYFIDNEFQSVKKWEKGNTVKSVSGDDFLEITVEAAGKGKFRAITVDMGKFAVGNLIVEVEGAVGEEILDFHYFQCLRDGIPIFIKPGGGCLIALAGRLRPVKGKTEHEFYHIIGGRHFSIVARDLTKAMKIKLRLRTAYYPFTMKGGFNTSDSVLNDIYAVCRHTQQICSIDAYVDTPWREQAQWWGDARVQAANTFFIDGDARLLARGIHSIAGQRAPQGLTYGHAPTSSGWCILPDFSLTWILTIWDYYWQTGDLKVFHGQHSRIKEILGYFESPDVRDKDGLLVYDPRFWLFEDWSTLPKERVPTFLNLWHIITLEYYAKLLKAAGKDAELRNCNTEISNRRKLVEKKLFDSKSGLFCACLDKNGKQSGEPSVHDQVMALMLNLKPEFHENMITKRILPYLKGEKASWPVPSAFWATYVFEVMGARGYGSEVVKFIREKWSPMISIGTTWEGFEWSGTGSGSCSHAWTAHPSFHFVNILAGIRQLGSAWESIEFAPHFADGIDFAETTVPSPKGEIKARWDRKGGNIQALVKIPSAMKLHVKLPGVNRIIAKAGTYKFQIHQVGEIT
jgi:alpha-L-rhamnosidase